MRTGRDVECGHGDMGGKKSSGLAPQANRGRAKSQKTALAMQRGAGFPSFGGDQPLGTAGGVGGEVLKQIRYLFRRQKYVAIFVPVPPALVGVGCFACQQIRVLGRGSEMVLVLVLGTCLLHCVSSACHVPTSPIIRMTPGQRPPSLGAPTPLPAPPSPPPWLRLWGKAVLPTVIVARYKDRPTEILLSPSAIHDKQ